MCSQGGECASTRRLGCDTGRETRINIHQMAAKSRSGGIVYAIKPQHTFSSLHSLHRRSSKLLNIRSASARHRNTPRPSARASAGERSKVDWVQGCRFPAGFSSPWRPFASLTWPTRLWAVTNVGRGIQIALPQDLRALLSRPQPPCHNRNQHQHHASQSPSSVAARVI